MEVIGHCGYHVIITARQTEQGGDGMVASVRRLWQVEQTLLATEHEAGALVFARRSAR